MILNNPVLREKEFFKNPNRFVPDRWTPDVEKSYYAISFNKGPQRCPGEKLVLSLASDFVISFLKYYRLIEYPSFLRATRIDTNYISQMMNPCKIQILVTK